MDFLHNWVLSGLGFLEGLQQWRTPLGIFYFRLMTFLGDEEFYLLALPAVYWLFSKSVGRRLVYLLLLTTGINAALKNFFQMPRPPVSLALVDQDGYGLPSGHAQNSVVLWGYAAVHLRGWRHWVLPLALWLVASTAFSRLFLGVHYPADVATGLVVGLFCLIGAVWAEPHLERWYGTLDAWHVAIFAIALSLLVLIVQPTGGLPWPSEDAASQAGLLCGVLIGLEIERRRVGFAVQGSLGQKIARYLLGVVLVLLAWGGLRAIFGLLDGGHLLFSALRIVRYAAIGFTVAWWAPAIFVRLGLAHKEQQNATT